MDIQYSDPNNSGSEINLQNDYVKLRYIRELNEKLGIVHSNIDGVVIDRKTIENIDAYLLKEESTISEVFNLKIIKNDKKNRTLKKNIEFLNKIYGSWTGMKIASNSKKHKVKTEFVTQGPYLANLQPPYELTYNKLKKSKCLINIDNAVNVKKSQIIVAEVLDVIIMDIIHDNIPTATLIPSKYKRSREEDDEQIELEKITINNKTYYTNDKKQGNLFEISENDSVGISIGNLINSIPYLF
jgi:hypothetical protein